MEADTAFEEDMLNFSAMNPDQQALFMQVLESVHAEKLRQQAEVLEQIKRDEAPKALAEAYAEARKAVRKSDASASSKGENRR